MPVNICILVEGIDDEQFLKAYIEHLSFDSKQFSVGNVGGKDNTDELRKEAERAIDRNQVVLVIFDANSDLTGARENIAGALQNLSYNHFLLPNDRSRGALENLLEEIINPEHQAIFDCFEEYEKCIDSKGYKAPSRKAKIYAYQWSNGLRKEERDHGNRHFDPNYWDFDNAALEPLKNFLSEHLARKP